MSGSILGVLGPNGAGNTTLLSVMANIIDPSSGTVTLRNKNNGRPASIADVRAYSHYWYVLPYEALMITAIDSGITAAEAVDRVDLTLKASGPIRATTATMVSVVGRVSDAFQLARALVRAPTSYSWMNRWPRWTRLGVRFLDDLQGRVGRRRTRLPWP